MTTSRACRLATIFNLAAAAAAAASPAAAAPPVDPAALLHAAAYKPCHLPYSAFTRAVESPCFASKGDVGARA
jgi:hypothetical protein